MLWLNKSTNFFYKITTKFVDYLYVCIHMITNAAHIINSACNVNCCSTRLL